MGGRKKQRKVLSLLVNSLVSSLDQARALLWETEVWIHEPSSAAFPVLCWQEAGSEKVALHWNLGTVM